MYDDFDRLSDSDSDDDKKREEEAHPKNKSPQKNNEIIVHVTVDDGHLDGPLPD